MGEVMRFSFLGLVVVTFVGTVGCSPSPAEAPSPAESPMSSEPVPSEPTAASAELGKWGVDLAHQDPSVAPGDDFFAFVNGTWLDQYEIPPDETRVGAFTTLRDRSEERVLNIIQTLADQETDPGSLEQLVGDYYASYMDTQAVNASGIDGIREELAGIASIATTTDLTHWLGRAGSDNTASPITAGASFDRKDPDRWILNIGHSGLGLPERDYYLEDSQRFVEIRAAYVKHIGEMLALVDYPLPEAAAGSIMALETDIARHHWVRADRRDRDLSYNMTTLDELGTTYPGLDWQTFFEAVGYVPDDLNVTHPSAISPLIALINDTPLDVWRAYLSYHLVTNNAYFLAESVDQANFAFRGKILQGRQEPEERWKRGVRLVGGFNGLGQALGRVYVDRFFPESSKTQMVELVENLREAYRRRIESLEWMGEETKKSALEKLAAFRPKIGYPNKWPDFDSISIDDDLASNIKQVRAFWQRDIIAKLQNPSDRDEWFMTPQTVNAYYNPSFNEIVFPAAILQAPFFDPAADAAVNYGAVGAAIGHEMGHGFDDQGSKVDANGIQRNWWTDDDRTNFEARTRNLAEQYGTFEAVPGTFVDGAFTLGENIGDLGGLEVALAAYRISLGGAEAPVIDGLTGEQRLFLSWAQAWRSKSREEQMVARLKSDPHAPPRYRVNGVVRNMDAWYDAFGVTEEHALYLPPERRVSIW